MTEPKLSDYSLIGNSRTAAIVSRSGSIEWCCLPDFDSPSIFTALLDREKGGSFSIRPAGEYHSTQKYIPETNVVETHFKTSEGEAHITQAFTVTTEEEKDHTLFPDHEILRIVSGLSGKVRMKLTYEPKIFYGRDVPHLIDHKKLGIHFSWKEHTYVLLTTLPHGQVRVEDNYSIASAEFLVTSGEQVTFSLTYSSQSPAILPEIRTTSWKRMEKTIAYWKNWTSKCKYTGLYQEHVKRSALALKLLTYAPSGAIVAAPTTSLPEHVGGERNWDYRYCWLRDASFTTRALVRLGFDDEVHAYMSWILHATQLSRPELHVVYSVFGHVKLKEQVLPWLCGYRDSTPVRIGNMADSQFQLDVYGEVLDAIYAYTPLAKKLDKESKKFILGLGEAICKLWDRPDNGIWEIRSRRIHHTHSKVMSWVGLDRLIKLCAHYQWKDAPVEKFRSTAALIREEVETFGYNSDLDSYTRELNGNDLDASLLTLSLVAYCDALSPRMRSTVQKITEQLSDNNLVYRYRNVDDGLAGEEGSFIVCSFWLAENLAKSGNLAKAKNVFETIIEHAGMSGLLSEEIDPESGALIGNYPQAFSHVGLINAALTINEEFNKS